MDLRDGKRIGLERQEEQEGQGDLEVATNINVDNGIEGPGQIKDKEEQTPHTKGKREEENYGIHMILMEIRKQEEKRQQEMQRQEEKRQKEMQRQEEKRQQEMQRQEEKRQQDKEEIKQEIASVMKKIEETKMFTQSKIEETKKEIRVEMIARIEEVEEFQDTKLKETENNLKKEIQEKEININSRMGKIENKIEMNKEEIKKMERDIIKNNKNIQMVEEKFNKELEINFNISEEENKRTANELKGEIQSIKSQIEQGRRGMTENLDYVGFRVMSGINHKFDGNIKRLHPKIFIKILKNKIRGINDIEDVKEIIRDQLENHPLIWFAAREKEIQNFDDFEKLFLQYFWGENIQASIRENLYFGKFLENKSSSLNNYAIHLHAMTQYLEPAIPEEEIIMFISRHYKPEIGETIAIQNIRTLDQLCNYLVRVERNLTTRNNNGLYNNNENSSGNKFNYKYKNEHNNNNFNRNNNFNKYSNNYNNDGMNDNQYYRRQDNDYRRYYNTNYNNNNKFRNDNTNYDNKYNNYNNSKNRYQRNERNSRYNNNSNRYNQETSYGTQRTHETRNLEGNMDRRNQEYENRRVNYQRIDGGITTGTNQDMTSMNEIETCTGQTTAQVHSENWIL